jgi:hypothetical protein
LSKNITASVILLILGFSGIKIHVFLFIIVSINHPSFTHKTGFQADIDSTTLIPKSSSIGI